MQQKGALSCWVLYPAHLQSGKIQHQVTGLYKDISEGCQLESGVKLGITLFTEFLGNERSGRLGLWRKSERKKENMNVIDEDIENT